MFKLPAVATYIMCGASLPEGAKRSQGNGPEAAADWLVLYDESFLRVSWRLVAMFESTEIASNAVVTLVGQLGYNSSR